MSPRRASVPSLFALVLLLGVSAVIAEPELAAKQEEEAVQSFVTTTVVQGKPDNDTKIPLEPSPTPFEYRHDQGIPHKDVFIPEETKPKVAAEQLKKHHHHHHRGQLRSLPSQLRKLATNKHEPVPVSAHNPTQMQLKKHIQHVASKILAATSGSQHIIARLNSPSVSAHEVEALKAEVRRLRDVVRVMVEKLQQLKDIEQNLFPEWAQEKHGACPDGWIYKGYTARNQLVWCDPDTAHHSPSPQNPVCRMTTRFPRRYKRCEWSSFCQAPWTHHHCEFKLPEHAQAVLDHITSASEQKATLSKLASFEPKKAAIKRAVHEYVGTLSAPTSARLLKSQALHLIQSVPPKVALANLLHKVSSPSASTPTAKASSAVHNAKLAAAVLSHIATTGHASTAAVLSASTAVTKIAAAAEKKTQQALEVAREKLADPSLSEAQKKHIEKKIAKLEKAHQAAAATSVKAAAVAVSAAITRQAQLEAKLATTTDPVKLTKLQAKIEKLAATVRQAEEKQEHFVAQAKEHAAELKIKIQESHAAIAQLADQRKELEVKIAQDPLLAAAHTLELAKVSHELAQVKRKALKAERSSISTSRHLIAVTKLKIQALKNQLAQTKDPQALELLHQKLTEAHEVSRNAYKRISAVINIVSHAAAERVGKRTEAAKEAAQKLTDLVSQYKEAAPAAKKELAKEVQLAKIALQASVRHLREAQRAATHHMKLKKVAALTEVSRAEQVVKAAKTPEAKEEAQKQVELAREKLKEVKDKIREIRTTTKAAVQELKKTTKSASHELKAAGFKPNLAMKKAILVAHLAELKQRTQTLRASLKNKDLSKEERKHLKAELRLIRRERHQALKAVAKVKSAIQTKILALPPRARAEYLRTRVATFQNKVSTLKRALADAPNWKARAEIRKQIHEAKHELSKANHRLTKATVAVAHAAQKSATTAAKTAEAIHKSVVRSKRLLRKLHHLKKALAHAKTDAQRREIRRKLRHQRRKLRDLARRQRRAARRLRRAALEAKRKLAADKRAAKQVKKSIAKLEALLNHTDDPAKAAALNKKLDALYKRNDKTEDRLAKQQETLNKLKASQKAVKQLRSKLAKTISPRHLTAKLAAALKIRAQLTALKHKLAEADGETKAKLLAAARILKLRAVKAKRAVKIEKLSKKLKALKKKLKQADGPERKKLEAKLKKIHHKLAVAKKAQQVTKMKVKMAKLRQALKHATPEEKKEIKKHLHMAKLHLAAAKKATKVLKLKSSLAKCMSHAKKAAEDNKDDVRRQCKRLRKRLSKAKVLLKIFKSKVKIAKLKSKLKAASGEQKAALKAKLAKFKKTLRKLHARAKKAGIKVPKLTHSKSHAHHKRHHRTARKVASLRARLRKLMRHKAHASEEAKAKLMAKIRKVRRQIKKALRHHRRQRHHGHHHTKHRHAPKPAVVKKKLRKLKLAKRKALKHLKAIRAKINALRKRAQQAKGAKREKLIEKIRQMREQKAEVIRRVVHLSTGSIKLRRHKAKRAMKKVKKLIHTLLHGKPKHPEKLAQRLLKALATLRVALHKVNNARARLVQMRRTTLLRLRESLQDAIHHSIKHPSDSASERVSELRAKTRAAYLKLKRAKSHARKAALRAAKKLKALAKKLTKLAHKYPHLAEKFNDAAEELQNAATRAHDRAKKFKPKPLRRAHRAIERLKNNMLSVEQRIKRLRARKITVKTAAAKNKLSAEIEALQTMAHNFQAAIKRQQKKIKHLLKKRVAKLNKKIQHLQERLDGAKTDAARERLKEKLEKARSKLTGVQDRLSALRKSRQNSVNTHLHSLHDQLKRVRAELRTQRAELKIESNSEAKEALKKKIAQLVQQAQGLKEEKRIARKALDHILREQKSSALRALEKVNERLKRADVAPAVREKMMERKMKLEEKIEHARQVLNKHMDEVANSKRRESRLRRVLNSAQRRQLVADRIRSKLQSMRQELSSLLDQQVPKAKPALREFTLRRMKLQSEVRAMKKEFVSSQTDALKQLRRARQILRRYVAKNPSDVSARDQLEELRKQSKAINQAVFEARTANRKLLNRAFSLFPPSVTQMNYIISDRLQLAKQQRTAMKERLNDFRERAMRLTERITRADTPTAKAELQSQLTYVNTRLKEFEHKVALAMAEVHRQRKKLSKSKRMIATLTAKVEGLREQRRALRQEKHELNMELDKLQATFAATTKGPAQAKLEQKIKQLHEKRDALKRKLQNLRAEIHKTSAHLYGDASLFHAATAADARSRAHRLKKRVKSIQKKIARMEKEIDYLKNAQTSITNTASPAYLQNAADIAELTKKLLKRQSQLENVKAQVERTCKLAMKMAFQSQADVKRQKKALQEERKEMRATVHEEVKNLGQLTARDAATDKKLTALALAVSKLKASQAAASKAGKQDEVERLKDSIESKQSRIAELKEQHAHTAELIAKAQATVESARAAFLRHLPAAARATAEKVIRAETKKFAAKQKLILLQEKYHSASGPVRQVIYAKMKRAEAKAELAAAKYRVAAKAAEIKMKKLEIQKSRAMLSTLKEQQSAATTPEERRFLARQVRQAHAKIRELKEVTSTLKMEKRREHQEMLHVKKLLRKAVVAVKHAVAAHRDHHAKKGHHHGHKQGHHHDHKHGHHHGHKQGHHHGHKKHHKSHKHGHHHKKQHSSHHHHAKDHHSEHHHEASHPHSHSHPAAPHSVPVPHHTAQAAPHHTAPAPHHTAHAAPHHTAPAPHAAPHHSTPAATHHAQPHHK